MHVNEIWGSIKEVPLGGDKTGRNPTDRGKRGVKRSVLTDDRGVPLGAVIDGANRNDHKLMRQTIEAIAVEWPQPAAFARSPPKQYVFSVICAISILNLNRYIAIVPTPNRSTGSPGLGGIEGFQQCSAGRRRLISTIVRRTHRQIGGNGGGCRGVAEQFGPWPIRGDIPREWRR
jgi:DDE family transposase